jgi:hypothetical protein
MSRNLLTHQRKYTYTEITQPNGRKVTYKYHAKRAWWEFTTIWAENIKFMFRGGV